MKARIRIEDLHVCYRGACSLHGINAVIPATGITAIIGPSGCGKTTLLKSLNRMLEETQRLMTEVVPADMGIYDTYIGFIKAVVKNLEIMQEAFNTRLSFVVDEKGAFPREAIYTDIDSEDFARQDQGGGHRKGSPFEIKYYKYKAKYMNLKEQLGI